LGVAVAAVAVISACDGGNGHKATYPIIAVDSQVVYAINSAPRNAPTAVYLYSVILGSSAVSASSDFSFDVAFDIDNQGRAVLLPVRTVASGLTGTHSVGLQVVSTPFDSLKFAPNKSYKYDSTLVVNAGQVVMIQSVGSACNTSLYANPYIYGKLSVDAIDASAHTLRLRYTVDPNCGFRSLATGVPKN
jgi:hypothetical protein